MKASFLSSLRMMWPQGINNKHQWRDLIRVYSMGWCDALMATEQRDLVEQWAAEFKPISDLNWWPDDTWKWW